MKRSSRNSKTRRRSKAEKEMFALRAIFNAMYAIGVSVRNVEEADQAIGLGAKLMSYALKRKITKSQMRARMIQLMEEHEASMTRH